ncbi:MAG: Methionine aminopeptidase [Chlamydiales bacterium]|nr:Methionine aminopeptidase [Chlamydiales bacterium]
MIGRNDLCWCGSNKKWKKCHFPKGDPTKALSQRAQRYWRQYQIRLKTPEEIAGIRRASIFAATVLHKLCEAAKEGVTTNELNALSEELHKRAKAVPAALNYGEPPFPKGICTSLNEVICHGIPDDVPLKSGDIMNIDVASILDGFYGDCSAMVVIGETTKERQLVVDVSKECLKRSIEILKPGVMLNEIGEAITSYAESQGCSVVYQFVGHGVGLGFHEAPQVHHNRNNMQIPLEAGMTFTIEPMINAGVAEGEMDESSGWIVYTADRKASAQWEHTLLITESGYEILTIPES